MARIRNSRNRPSKICPVCQRPFTWRKKWQDCWEEVKYCTAGRRLSTAQIAVGGVIKPELDAHQPAMSKNFEINPTWFSPSCFFTVCR